MAVPESVTNPRYGRDMSDLQGTEVPVEVVRSVKRVRTAQAKLNEGRIKVMVPAGLSRAEEQRIVADLVAKVRRQLESHTVDIDERARAVANRYRLPHPTSVEWSDRQMKRWGSASPHSGRIRISSRLLSAPPWVLDWVLMHELAHLVEANHGPRFKEIVTRYPLAERATGYLMALDQKGSNPTES